MEVHIRMMVGQACPCACMTGMSLVSLIVKAILGAQAGPE